MGDVFMVASGKGGVGKTTLCAMLGSQFARMDKTVVMLDTDFGLRNLDLYFHLENKIIYNAKSGAKLPDGKKQNPNQKPSGS